MGEFAAIFGITIANSVFTGVIDSTWAILKNRANWLTGGVFGVGRGFRGWFRGGELSTTTYCFCMIFDSIK